ncbi:MAG: trypsin-like peptidase domain-containing protein [Myxococcota bacterium]|nr:trypsin-like peptidase domain-containing protein [Myxococcota bacterium]
MFRLRRPKKDALDRGRTRHTRRIARALGLLLALAFPLLEAQGVIIASGDGSGNTTAPPDDPGFASVGSVNGLSGVYLGNGWVLTAHHVGQGTLEFGGNSFEPIPGSWQRLTGTGIGPPDLAVLRMAGDPGLPVTALATSSPPVGSEVVMVGRGLSRGTALTWNGKDGWNWTQPRVKRWGKNRVSTTGSVILNTDSLILNFDAPGASAVTDEATVAVGDSGGALYRKSGGTWYLAGTLFVALTSPGQPTNTSLYSNASAAADISTYRDEILAIIGVPACSNGLDDDLDGQIDSGADPGCDDANDASEQSPLLVCDDGLDNDSDGLIDFPADPGCLSSNSPEENADWDGDTIPNTNDNCPMVANTDQANFDGDTEGDVCDPDDDNDGLPDSAETNTGVYIDSNDTGTDPLNSDSDGDGILDGDDIAPNNISLCPSVNPQLKLVWGHPTPFGLVHRKNPGMGDLYLLDEDPSLSLPGYSGNNPTELQNLMEILSGNVDELFNNARPNELPATLRALEVGILGDTDPLPITAGDGSPSLIYLIDGDALLASNPDFGPLEGFTWSKLNRFTSGCTGGQAAVIIRNLPAQGTPNFEFEVQNLAEDLAHQAGHLYGLRHILPDGFAACSGPVPGPTPAIMDGFDDDESAELVDCTASLGSACPVSEAPDCGGLETGETHNPLYHFLHFLIGDSTADLAAAALTPGGWDIESDPLVTWLMDFDFACPGGCAGVDLYEVSIIEVLPGDGEIVRHFYPSIALDDINALQIQIPESSGLRMTASSVDPASLPGGATDSNVFLENPLYPPAYIGQSISLPATLLEVAETSPGVYVANTLATDGDVISTPIYETREDGTYDLSVAGQPQGVQLTTSTYSPPLMVVGAPISVPEPAAVAALGAGAVALLVLRRRQERRP